MSMQKLICPNCNKENGTVSINDHIEMATVKRICSKCHKSYAYKGIFGDIKYIS